MDMVWRKCVAGMVALVCALAGTCAQAQESLFLEELWRAAMEDAVFSEDSEVRELVSLTPEDDAVIWDEAGERVLLLTWHDYERQRL